VKVVVHQRWGDRVFCVALGFLSGVLIPNFSSADIVQGPPSFCLSQRVLGYFDRPGSVREQIENYYDAYKDRVNGVHRGEVDKSAFRRYWLGRQDVRGADRYELINYYFLIGDVVSQKLLLEERYIWLEEHSERVGGNNRGLIFESNEGLAYSDERWRDLSVDYYNYWLSSNDVSGLERAVEIMRRIRDVYKNHVRSDAPAPMRLKPVPWYLLKYSGIYEVMLSDLALEKQNVSMMSEALLGVNQFHRKLVLMDRDQLAINANWSSDEEFIAWDSQIVANIQTQHVLINSHILDGDGHVDKIINTLDMIVSSLSATAFFCLQSRQYDADRLILRGLRHFDLNESPKWRGMYDRVKKHASMVAGESPIRRCLISGGDVLGAKDIAREFASIYKAPSREYDYDIFGAVKYLESKSFLRICSDGIYTGATGSD